MLHEIMSVYDRAYAERGIMGTHFDREYSSVTKSILLEYCRAAPNNRLLDLGTGDGDLWEFADAGLERYGLDLSLVGVRTSARRFPGVHGVVGVAETIPFPDAFFGAVVAADTLEHTIDLEASLAEIRRILAPQGILAYSVPAPDSLRKWAYNTFAKRRPELQTALRLISIVLKRIVIFGRADFQPIDRDLDLEAWTHRVAAAGFNVVASVEWPAAPMVPIVYLMAASGRD